MLYGLKDVFNISIFSEEGNHVVTLDTIKEHKLFKSNKDNKHYLFIKDSMLNEDILKLFSEEKIEELTDYEKMLGNKPKKTYVFKNKEIEKTYKIVGKGRLRNANGNDDFCTFNILKVKPINDIDFRAVCDDVPVDFHYMFEIINDKDNDVVYSFILD